MKNALRIIVIILAVMLCLIVAPGKTYAADIVASGTCGAEGDNLTWTLDSGGVLTISGTGAMASYSVASDTPWYTDYREAISRVVISQGVNNIGDYAFSWICLTSIDIPESVTTIGYSAFSGSDLTEIIIPEGVTSISAYAFDSCRSLTSITIPESVTSIGQRAFGYCYSLTQINYNAVNVTGINPNYTANLFWNSGTRSDGITVVFGDAVESIPDYLFYCNDDRYGPKITSVTFGANIKRIGSDAFCYCKWLNSVIIPDGVTSIGTSAFQSCVRLTEVQIPESVTAIGQYVFYGCSNLTSVTIPENVASLGNYSFGNCSKLTEIYYNARNVSSIIGSSGICPDSGNAGGVAVIIGDTVETIPSYFLYNCPCVTSVTMKDGVKKIGSYAFSGCTGLTSFAIGDGVQTIEYFAFRGCTGLTSMTIPENVTNCSYAVFADCTGLTEIIYNARNMNDGYGNDVFDGAGAPGLAAVIGEEVEAIPSSLFYNCANLTSVTIPESVTSIGFDAFNGCSPDLHIYYAGTVCQWDAIGGNDSFEEGQALLEAAKGEHYCSLPEYIWSENYDACTASGTCSYCHIAKSENASVSLIDTSTCTESGTLTYTAEFTDPMFETQTVTFDSPATGHAWSEPEWTWTGSSAATATFTCANDPSHVETIDAAITSNGGTCTATVVFEGVTYTNVVHIHDGVSFTAWESSNSLPSAAGSYYLTADVTLSSRWNVSGGRFDLCLNGHSITMTGSNSVIYIRSNAVLNLYDCGDTGTITGGNASNGGGVYDTGTFNMFGGTITGNSASSNGGGVYVYNDGSYTSTFNLNGGTISNNTASSNGGGVYVLNDSTFTMNGGAVTGNTALTGGGLATYGTSTVNSGYITNNRTINTGSGGGVYLAGGTLTVNDGAISGNTSSNNGGGVFVEFSSNTFYFNGGSVDGNTAVSGGGGVYMSNGTLVMTGGSISGNSAKYGAGLVLNSTRSALTMSDGAITQNTATESGGAVFNWGCITMTGGSISANTAPKAGGIVLRSGSVTRVSGGPQINGNTNGNICLNDSGILIIVNGALTGAGNSIGISSNTAPTCSAPVVFTSGLTTSNNGDYGMFFSDDPACTISLSATGEAQLTKEHTPGEEVRENEVEATCITDGGYDAIVYCTVCGEEVSRYHVTINALGHALEHHEGQAATCTAAGWEAYDTCSRCDYTTYAQIAALGHDWSAWEVPADGNGESVRTCGRCGAKEVAGTAGNLTWEIDSNGMLTISGTGAMTGCPWTSYSDLINRAVIENGVTTVLWNAFEECWNITSISFPTGIVFDASAICVRPTNSKEAEGFSNMIGYHFLPAYEFMISGDNYSKVTIASFGELDILYADMDAQTVDEVRAYAEQFLSGLKAFKPEWENETGHVVLREDLDLFNYSDTDEMLKARLTLPGYSIEYYSGYGDGTPLWSSSSLGTVLCYNGIMVADLGKILNVTRNVIYVPGNTENTPEALADAAIKRIKDELGLDVQIVQGSFLFEPGYDPIDDFDQDYIEEFSGVAPIDDPDHWFIVDPGDNEFYIVISRSDEHAHSHTPGEAVRENVVEATCTEEGGYDLVVYCSDCGEELSREHVVVPALGHDWSDPTYTWAEDNSTVTAEMVCSRDATHKITEVSSTVYEVVNEATPDEDGYATYTAEFENNVFTKQVKTITLPALGHVFEFIGFTWTKTEDGYTAVADFRCTTEQDHNVSVEAEVSNEVTVEAACETAGTIVYTASVSVDQSPDNAAHSATETVIIEPLGHDYHEVTIEPTCTDWGSVNEVCIRCGHIGSSSNIEPLGHSWNVPEYAWADDYSTVTATRVCMNDSSHVETETAHAELHIMTEPTCTEPGGGYCYASFENPAFESQMIDVDLPMIDHTPGEPVHEHETPATYTEEGGYDLVVYCTVCSTELSREHVSTGLLIDNPVINSLTNGDTNSGITVNWTTQTSYSKFRIQRKATGESKWTTITSTATGTSYVDKKASVGGATYAYRVSGYTDGAWTDYSETVSLIRNPFTDVKTSASYFKALCWAYNNGIVAGTSTTRFSPNDNCTRGQFALMLWRMNGKPSTAGLENPFTDVKSSNGFYNGIVWCYNKGITAGTSATTFSPNNNITRWQMILMFWRMQNKPKSSLTENPFTDVKTTASYYKAALWAYEKRITAVEKFMPNDLCTRWQLVLFLYRLNNLYHYI